MNAPPLDEFLSQMAAMLDRQRSAHELEVVMGKSPSGTARLALYCTLVQRQQCGIIDDFYSAVRVALDSGRQGRFAKLRDAYLSEHPPSHWVPARAAQHFPGFLERRAVAADAIELADFVWTRHQVLMAPTADDVSGLAVRHYTHAVLRFTQAVEHDGRTTGRPERQSETWLLGRSPQTAGLLAVKPSVAALVVVQVVEDQSWSADLPNVPREQLLDEADSLCRLGLLSDRARAALETWLP